MTVSQAGRTCVAVAVLWLGSASDRAVYAQASAENPGGSINLGARGAIAFPAPPRTAPAQDRPESPVEFSFRAGVATDYIYRGVTLSAHEPAAGAALEVALGMFYAGGTIASVKLPSQPAAEVSFSGGVRPKLGNVQFDFGVTSYLYPNETPPIGVAKGIDYWEAVARADTTLGDTLQVAGGFAWSPNISNTGAWGMYAAFGAGFDLPGKLLPQDVSASVTAGTGYSWFGNQSAALGGFPLPAYLNWNAGITFTYKNLNLDLRYSDTNLSKENCFVFTGDPNATPGGQINPLTNPQGLVSNWCRATFVAKFSFALN
ncbi:MAG: TorF family putative porin [Xanthobacteraceae bacterium]